jgi:DNA-binding MarR family transcriptional regulator
MSRDCLAVRLRVLGRAVSRIYDAELRPHGLTISQLNVLLTVAHYQPVAAGKVADALSMDVSTLSRNAQVLRRGGLLEVRRADRGNGRVLELTPAGATKLAEVEPAWASAQRRARELLGRDAAAAIAGAAEGLWTEAAR